MMKQWQLILFLMALLLFLIAYPYFHKMFPNQIAVVELFFALIMVGGLSVLTHRKSTLIITSLLAILVLIGILLSSYTHNPTLLGLTIITELVFFGIVFITVLSYAYSQDNVTSNKLLAAIISYLVLGIMFALVFTLIAIYSPQSFRHTVTQSPPNLRPFSHPDFFSEAIYFSFVTLSTLGYGDWVPMQGPVKIISALEAIAGQLFISMLIARLVGIHIAQTVLNRKK
jgi:cbb3-type cytochrome oxidase subunit 3